jgi:hypothetical protein
MEWWEWKPKHRKCGNDVLRLVGRDYRMGKHYKRNLNDMAWGQCDSKNRRTMSTMESVEERRLPTKWHNGSWKPKTVSTTPKGEYKISGMTLHTGVGI